MEWEDDEQMLHISSVSGFFVIRNFLSEEEHQACLDAVLNAPFELTRSGTRRFQSYVPWEPTKSGKRYKKENHQPLPDYAQAMVQKMLTTIKETIPNHDWSQYETMLEDGNSELQVNEYFPDSTLPFHFDDVNAYKPVIFGISLGSDW
jgi:alkylated DNA repair dioxygenase AlkB